MTKAGLPVPRIEMDSAGFLLHLSTCGVTDGVDDGDCTCGAHAVNQHRLNWAQPLRDQNDALRTEIERYASQSRRQAQQIVWLRATLTEIMQGARSLDYAIQLARVALANDQ